MSDRLWDPHSLLSNGYWTLFLWGVKWSESEIDHLTPSSSKLKNGCSYISSLAYDLLACDLAKHRDNFAFIMSAYASAPSKNV